MTPLEELAIPEDPHRRVVTFQPPASLRVEIPYFDNPFLIFCPPYPPPMQQRHFYNPIIVRNREDELDVFRWPYYHE